MGLYGGSVGKALKQALAAELAHIAGVAAVKALYATALGFLSLAEGNFSGAAQAFISAGLWAALAAGTALAARAVAGNSNQNSASSFKKQSQASGGNISTTQGRTGASGDDGKAYSSSGNDVRRYEEDRLRGSSQESQRPVRYDVLHLKISPDLIERHMIDKIHSRGGIRQVIIDAANS